ncbi:hypothetical protein [Alloscardovia omnicolens]|uniref:hypothetical protein n=1 Tax=Alloscardovia omnicolens TaxID=419015 RepID=UPI0003B70776|nr:hypothetical protein [Alloscardovia omnicolens]
MSNTSFRHEYSRDELKCIIQQYQRDAVDTKDIAQYFDVSPTTIRKCNRASELKTAIERRIGEKVFNSVLPIKTQQYILKPVLDSLEHRSRVKKGIVFTLPFFLAYGVGNLDSQLNDIHQESQSQSPMWVSANTACQRFNVSKKTLYRHRSQLSHMTLGKTAIRYNFINLSEVYGIKKVYGINMTSLAQSDLSSSQ